VTADGYLLNAVFKDVGRRQCKTRALMVGLSLCCLQLAGFFPPIELSWISGVFKYLLYGFATFPWLLCSCSFNLLAMLPESIYHIFWGSGGLMTRLGIAQELGAPRECPPYPYTLKIVEAG